MKAFEKWCDEIEYCCVDYSKRDSMRRGWKAAVEWALQQQYVVGDEPIELILKKELDS